MSEVSALPSSMQARRAALTQPGGESSPAPAPAPAGSSTTPAPAPSSAVEPTEAKVTISRAEFNDLQAAAGKARAAEGRTEALQMDVEALTRRLTELEDGSKGSPKPKASPAPSAESWEPSSVEYTKEENEDYGESKSFVEKVVQEVLNKTMPKFNARLDSIEEHIANIRGVAEGASKTASTIRAKSYTDKVKEEVPEFEECTNHKNWGDFTLATDPDTGDTWGELIQRNFNKENVRGMVRIFNTFKKQYAIGSAPRATGYEGAMPNGGSGSDEEVDVGPKTLPFSRRKEAHKQYINKEITYDEYERIKNEYDVADREGRVDYNK